MENIKVLIDGIQKDVYGIFYIYNSKYYFIYTEKELDENGYVILYMSQVGKETANTPNGPVETGYMIGIEITDPEEQKSSQESISCIVEDKKNNTQNSKIQYLPMSMLVNFKILSKKRFRLLKSIIVDNFKLNFDDVVAVNNVVESQEMKPISSYTPVPVAQMEEEQQVVEQPTVEEPIVEPIQTEEEKLPSELLQTSEVNDNVIIDYRTRYFEEEEKNNQLQAQIDILTAKLEEIKKVIE